jgi:hypothetical protein
MFDSDHYAAKHHVITLGSVLKDSLVAFFFILFSPLVLEVLKLKLAGAAEIGLNYKMPDYIPAGQANRQVVT